MAERFSHANSYSKYDNRVTWRSPSAKDFTEYKFVNIGGYAPIRTNVRGRRLASVFLKLWDEGQQVGKLIRLGIQHDYRDGQCVEVLLILEILVDRDKGVELVCGWCEELAVPDAAPPHFDHRAYSMVW